MIGLDTNIILRYVMQDDPAQARRATKIMERHISQEKRGFIPTIVLVETCWATPAHNASFLGLVSTHVASYTLRVMLFTLAESCGA